MKKAIILILTIVLFSSSIFGLSKKTKEPEKFPVVESNSDFVVNANNEFGIEIFKKLYSGKPDENIFISPLSISMALSMVQNGSENETQNEILTALKLSGISEDIINSTNLSLMNDLTKGDQGVELKIGNSIWVNKFVALKENFIAKMKQFYFARVEALDMSSSKSAGTINGWVSDATRNMITKVIDRTEPDDLLYLINAIYFKGEWTEQFKPSATRPRQFHAPSEEYEIKMMNKTSDMKYFTNDNFQAVSLPYKGGKYSMNIFLPDESKTIDDFLKLLTFENWHTWNESFFEKEGNLVLPKFQIEYESLLNSVLKELGIEQAFANADFSRLTDTDVNIDRVLHKSILKVDEEGSEAAAVTVVTMKVTSVSPANKFYMTCDRPFFCSIVDNETGAILFMGIINEPDELN